MPNWGEVLKEIQDEIKGPGRALDTVRRRHLTSVQKLSKRNTIAYYSGWLQRPNVSDTAINDKDKSGFMLAIHKMDKSKGLDILIHSPGGDLAATESLVDYLYSIFGKDIRVIVPQLSMSAGTMIAFAAKEIVMGKQSNLGPIDPQIGGVACEAILEEFETAKKDIRSNPHSVALWQTIISKYHPTLLGSCEKAIEWSEKMASKWLLDNMCKGDKKAVEKIMDTFADHKKQLSHARHISKEECESVGLNVTSLEKDKKFQDAVLTTHHAFMHTISSSEAVKIIENHMGIAYIENAPK